MRAGALQQTRPHRARIFVVDYKQRQMCIRPNTQTPKHSCAVACRARPPPPFPPRSRMAQETTVQPTNECPSRSRSSHPPPHKRCPPPPPSPRVPRSPFTRTARRCRPRARRPPRRWPCARTQPPTAGPGCRWAPACPGGGGEHARVSDAGQANGPTRRARERERERERRRLCWEGRGPTIAPLPSCRRCVRALTTQYDSCTCSSTGPPSPPPPPPPSCSTAASTRASERRAAWAVRADGSARWACRKCSSSMGSNRVHSASQPGTTQESRSSRDGYASPPPLPSVSFHARSRSW